MKNKQALLEHIAYNLRVSSIVSTSQAGSGHPTSCLSAADLVAGLFFYAMRFDPKNPDNPNNDRFILSKGHAAPLLYAAWQQAGVLSDEDLLTLRKFDSVLEGHPTLRFKQSEAATGSLGQGLSVGVGMALSAKKDNFLFRTYVLLGDSEVTEGSVWEAAEVAAHYKLNNLIAVLDVNRLGQSTPTTAGYDLDKYINKFQAFGFNTVVINGHDMKQVMWGYDQARFLGLQHDRPSIIIAKTTKGKGVKQVEDKEGFHGKPFAQKDVDAILKELKKTHKDAAAYKGDLWEPELPEKVKAPTKCKKKIDLPAPSFKKGEKLATRKAYGQALAAVGKSCERVIALDAEVKNSTFAQTFEKEFPERFVQSFIAEQNMVGMGIGFYARNHLPFISTFASFLTRAYDQMRMAAIGRTALRISGSHAGVSIGADGPSQMGLEDIAMMRALPSSVVFYPCDAVSTYKLVAQMANYRDGISYIRTTRMDTPVIYDNDEEFPVGGCKVLRQSNDDKACIVAAGVTLFQALEAYEQLQKEGISIAVIDLYSIKPLDEKMLRKVGLASGKRIITVEDHYLEGGLGQAVVYALRNSAITTDCLAVNKLPRSGTPDELLAYEEIDADAIIAQVKKA